MATTKKTKSTDKKHLLEVRKKIKSKKPTFMQQDFHKKKRLSAKWKRPTGIQSKMRHRFKGYARRISSGWRSPVEVRDYHPSGYKPIIVFNVADVSKIKAGEAAMISSTVGIKKKLDIIKKAEELKVKVLNIKVDAFKAKVAQSIKVKSEEKKSKEEHKKKSIEEAVKKAEVKKEKEAKKKAKQENNDDAELAVEQAEEIEEKREQEKKEKDDVLIHKQ